MNRSTRPVFLACAVTVISLPIAVSASDEDTESARTGEFRISATLPEVAGADIANTIDVFMSPGESITWDIYVPDRYRPDIPAGLMVYISPSNSGEIPQHWKAVMGDRNVIWVAARKSGNKIAVARRAVYAIAAPTLIGKDYKIDRDRIYLSGLSGGGRVASRVATDFAQLFKGAIFNCGVDFWEAVPVHMDRVKQNRYVFVTGTKDHARQRTVKVYEQYVNSGIENSKLMIVEDMEHRNPDSKEFEEAIQYLDSPN